MRTLVPGTLLTTTNYPSPPVSGMEQKVKSPKQDKYSPKKPFAFSFTLSVLDFYYTDTFYYGCKQNVKFTLDICPQGQYIHNEYYILLARAGDVNGLSSSVCFRDVDCKLTALACAGQYTCA